MFMQEILNTFSMLGLEWRDIFSPKVLLKEKKRRGRRFTGISNLIGSRV